jgi:hypothetical protein
MHSLLANFSDAADGVSNSLLRFSQVVSHQRMIAFSRSSSAHAGACLALILASSLGRADSPKGIYILGSGTDNPLTPQDDRLSNIRDYDFVSGYTLRVRWSDLEPSPGVYDFGVVDAAIGKLAPLGQGLNLEIFTGEEPAYVLAGATATYLDHRGGTNPVPWDPFAQARHAALFTALGSHVVVSAGAPHPLRDDPTLRSIDAAPAGLNFGVRDLNGAIRTHPGYTQQRYVDAVVGGVNAAATAFPHDLNFLAFFAFNDLQPGTPVDEQLIERLAPRYNGPGQPQLAFFVENLSDEGPLPQPNGMGAGSNLLDWSNLGGPTMMQALDSWLVHRPDRDAQLASLTPATGIELGYNTYGTRFFELYVADLDRALAGALDAAGRLIVDDLRTWNEILQADPHDADFDGNGAVDAADLARWQTHFGKFGDAAPAHGDANNDRVVDGADFLVWQRQHGAPAATLNIPEPAAGLIAIAAAVVCAAAFRRRRHAEFAA